jgi:hypothetical protein
MAAKSGATLKLTKGNRSVEPAKARSQLSDAGVPILQRALLDLKAHARVPPGDPPLPVLAPHRLARLQGLALLMIPALSRTILAGAKSTVKTGRTSRVPEAAGDGKQPLGSSGAHRSVSCCGSSSR